VADSGRDAITIEDPPFPRCRSPDAGPEPDARLDLHHRLATASPRSRTPAPARAAPVPGGGSASVAGRRFPAPRRDAGDRRPERRTRTGVL